MFPKVDVDPAHADVEVRAMALAPVPTPAVLWHEPPVLAIAAAVPGTALGVLGECTWLLANAVLPAGVVRRNRALRPWKPAFIHGDLQITHVFVGGDAWWSLRSLVASHWLIEHGFDPDAPGCEFDVPRSRMREP
ncbi:hypothetical protein [Saccharothrix longispora]|uniref:hypothetical protein n=1 Tax=Saccharothrix longispora TaxID=33920 RepID=UPI0028FD871E|nr:hypothetical protein [Saccharothrix longispora]MDU0290290.1 hypothetical protein [Saccharothrix longispora]